MRTGLFMILAIASSTAAFAEKPKDKGDKDQVICRTEADIGSRLGGTRVCMTREQWAERRRESREAAERAQMGHTDRGNGG